MIEKELLYPGAQIRIVKKWCDGCRENWNGKMDKWLGKIVTVKSVYDSSNGSFVYIEEDEGDGCYDGHWRWFLPAIECIVDEAEDEKPFEFSADFMSLFA